MKRIALILTILVLAGCCFNGNSPAYITYFLNKGYDGHPVNQFFADYGYPAGVFELANGSKVYRWVSTQYKVSPHSATPVEYVSSNGQYQIVDVYRGYTERNYCELRIDTDAADNIKDFSVAVDSTGKWSTSRCSELFDKVYP